MYFDGVYKLYLEYFHKFCILAETNAKNHNFHGAFMVFARIVPDLDHLRDTVRAMCVYGEGKSTGSTNGEW